MPELQQSLNQLAPSFSVTRLADPDAGKFRIRVDRPGGGAGAVTIALDQGTEMVLKDSTIDLALLTKAVRFEDTLPGNSSVKGGMPITDVDPVPFGTDLATGLTGTALFMDLLAKVTSGPVVDPATKAPTPGVPGLLATLGGTVQVPMEVARPQLNQAVQVRVRVTLVDAAGNHVNAIRWSVGNTTSSDAQFELPATAVFNEITGTLIAATQELDGSPDLVITRYVLVEVNVSALGASSGWVALPRIPVVVPILRIPTVFVGFRFTDFTGNFLIIVPANSALNDMADVTAALGTVTTAVNSIRDSVEFATFFLGKLGALSGALAGVPAGQATTFVKGNQPNLNDITLVQNAWYENDMEAEDEFSSLFLIGPNARVCKLYNARDYNDGEGQMNLNLGRQLSVSIRDTNSKNPVEDPDGVVYLAKVPPGSRTFHNEISSVKFV